MVRINTRLAAAGLFLRQIFLAYTQFVTSVLYRRHNMLR